MNYKCADVGLAWDEITSTSAGEAEQRKLRYRLIKERSDNKTAEAAENEDRERCEVPV